MFFFIKEIKIYELKERYLQVYKKEFQLNFINIYIYIYIFFLFYLEKDSLLLIYLDKEFHKFVPKDSNFIKKEFWISSSKRLVYQFIKKRSFSSIKRFTHSILIKKEKKYLKLLFIEITLNLILIKKI